MKKKSEAGDHVLIYPEEYKQFARLVKQITLLDVLGRALRVDQFTLSCASFKLQRPIEQQFEKTRKQIDQDLVQARRALRGMGGKIIEVRQRTDVREVKARFRGFIYTKSYVNELLRGECERLLSSYWVSTHPFRGDGGGVNPRREEAKQG